MKFTPTDIADVVIVESSIFADERGFFMESWHAHKFSDAGLPVVFVQENYSRSRHGTLRGLHYQVEHAQGKLVRAVSGTIFDVAVDLRRDSPSFGRWVGAELASERGQALWIPRGFAHGYYVLSDVADVIYLCTEVYHPESERTIRWNDGELAIAWPIPRGQSPITSAKDRSGAAFREADHFGPELAPLSRSR